MTKRSLLRVGAGIVAAAVVPLGLHAHSPVPRRAPAAGWTSDFRRDTSGWRVRRPVAVARVRSGDQLALRLTRSGRGGGTVAHELPSPPWALSFDLELAPRSAVSVQAGGRVLVLSRLSRVATIRSGRYRGRLAATVPWRRGWRHVELVSGPRAQFTVDGALVPVSDHGTGPLVISPLRGTAEIANVIATPASAGYLLAHRLAAIHAETPPGRFPEGAALDGTLHFSGGWTTGFWPGALWQAAALLHGSDLFRVWALAATEQNLGRERADTHDLGFMYETSSALAYDRLCARAVPSNVLCARFRASALTAADSLVRLEQTNSAAGLIPLDAGSCWSCPVPDDAVTIIDSMMNLPLLVWASQETADARYAAIASRHARNVASLLVRSDGSSIQAVRVRRSDGRVLGFETHQGISVDSTWARGQGWGLYGFAYVGAGLHDAELVSTSERMARYVAARLPSSGVPPWDYDAPHGAPPDVSAGVVTAAGLLHLDAACRAVPGACAEAGRWGRLGAQMLRAALRYERRTPPLGLLASQVYDMHRATEVPWNGDGELIFGLHYALEAAGLSGVR